MREYAVVPPQRAAEKSAVKPLARLVVADGSKFAQLFRTPMLPPAYDLWRHVTSRQQRPSQNRHALECVFQFPDVSRPWIGPQQGQSLFVDPAGADSGSTAQEVLCQQRHVFSTFAQRRQVEGHHVQSVVEVLTKLSGAHLCCQVDVGRRHDTDVRRDRTITANSLETPFLQHPQQARLHTRVGDTHLVDEQSATARLLEPPEALAHGTGESTFLMTEQLRLENTLGERGAVDFDKGAVGAPAVFVNDARQNPFPVPLSPVSNTVASSLATRFTCATRRRINAHPDGSRADGGAGLRGRIDVTTLAAGWCTASA